MTTPTTVNVRLQLRADTAANWTAANPILLANEVGLETDTKKLKVGNGSSAWNSLAYFPSIVSGGTVLGNLEIGSTGTLTFEGSSADGFETTLAVTNPTADRTITLPNQSGTVVVSGNASIVDADIAANAEIAVSKLADGSARQLLQTDAAGTGVEWTSNVDIPGTLNVTGAATFDGAVTVAGDLTVNGTTTNINTQNLVVEDKNIILGDVATPTDVTADGGGITLKGATDKTINWVDATDAWTSSEHINIASGKEYRIAGTKVLDATSLGGSVLITSANITDGTIVNGDINASAAIAGTKISPDFGSQTVTTTGVVSAAAGSAGSPSITFTGDLNTGLYSPGSDQVAIATGGTGRLFVDASGNTTANGNVSAGAIGSAGRYFARRAEGSYDSPTAITTSVNVGTVIGQGYDGAAYRPTGSVIFGSDGAISSTSSPGFITLSTTASGAAAVTERLRITSAGLVGVGTSSPINSVDVNGGVGVHYTYGIRAYRDQETVNNLILGHTYTNSNDQLNLAPVGQSPTSAIAFKTATGSTLGTRMFIGPTGNVGIGTTSPATPLEVSGTSAQIRVIDSAVDMRVLPLAGGQAGIFGTASNHSLVLWTNSTERARIDSSGRLLVGTSSTRSVAGNFGSTTNQILFETVDIASFTAVGNKADSSGPQFVLGKSRSGAIGGVTAVQNGDVLGVIKFAGANGTDLSNVGAEIYTAVDGTPFSSGDTTDLPGRLVFGTTADGDSGPTERMRITNDGKLLFACIGDPSSTIKGGAYIANTTSPYFSSSAGTSTSSYAHFYFINGNGTVGSISTSGSATAYNTSSDYRLKENVTVVTDGITRLQQLKPSRFNFIADPAKTVDGFIAHEVQSVVPEAITGEKDAVDDDGNPIYQGIDQSKLVPLLTAALQEAIAKIESLEARLSAAGL